MHKILRVLVAINMIKNVYGQNVETCFHDKFCIPANYSRFDRPDKGKTRELYVDNFRKIEITQPILLGPLQIMLDIDVVEILEINDRDFSATFMLYFGASWKESRLRNNITARIPVDVSILDKFWVPDIHIYNMKKFKMEKIFTEIAGNQSFE